MPKEYKIPLTSKKLLRGKKDALEVIQYTVPKAQRYLNVDAETKITTPDVISIDDVIHLGADSMDLAKLKPQSPDVYEVLDTEACSTRGDESLILDYFNTLNQCDPYPTHKQRFISACVNGYIGSLGPQYTHPLLTTQATFTPLLQQHEVIETVAEACGCSFLSWDNPDLTELSYTKYQHAVSSLMKYVNGTTVKRQDEAWLGAAFQLLCLAAKITYKCDNRVSVRNLKNSYRLIKFKSERLGTGPPLQEVCGPERSSEGIFEDFTGDNLKMEIENSLIGYEGKDVSMEKHFERMFTESFIYNFSVSVLITDDLEGLPNPFEVFRTLKNYVKTPLFSCDVVWMNNPVLGAAFDAFELVAKSSYLIRHMDDPLTIPCARKLLEIASFYPTPMIPSEIRVDESKYMQLRDSVFLSDIVMKAAKVVLRKVLVPTLSEHDPNIQKDVEFVVSKLKQIPETSSVWIISAWAMFIMGLVAVKPDHRETMVDALYLAAEKVHGRYIGTILDVLELSWGIGSKNGLMSTSRGLDVLFDHHLLSNVFI
jgi:hypothetical protein